MQGYLQRNRFGYNAMFEDTLTTDVLPAVLFNPIPQNFNINQNGLNAVLNWGEQATLPDTLDKLAFYPVSQLAFLVRTQQVSSRQLTKIFLDRIRKYDPQLQAVITVTEERAYEMADKADREISAGNYKGPLHGIPYGVKDLVSVQGYPTTWGAEPFKDQAFSYDAEIVKRFDEAGAVLIAKLVSGSLARGDVWFGGKTKNPWNLEEGASGSSAGSGSAMSAGLVAFSIGTETLGSITSPSTRCGVTGLRPTYGRVSRAGVMALSWTMDKVGPICRTAQDAALVLQAINGVDLGDPMTTRADLFIDFSEDPKQLKIAYFKSLFDRDTTVSGDNSRKVISWLESEGYEMDSVSLPKTLPFSSFDVILRAEAGAFFEDLVRSGGDKSMVQQDDRSRANSLRQSWFIPAVEYIQANRHRTKLIEDFHEVAKDYDVILSPTFGGKQLLITNLTGHPAISIPTGFNRENSPTSITLLGNLFDEESILRLAHYIQNESEFKTEIPPGFGL